MTSSLIHKPPHESDKPFATSLYESFQLLKPQLKPPFSLAILTQPQYLNLNSALLYAILTCEPHHVKIHLKHLHGIVTDGYSLFTSLVTKLVNELYQNLVENVKLQLIWVVSELIDVNAVGVEGLLVALLRQTRGGDFSDGNLWLCSELVGIFLVKWECLVENEAFVVSCGLFVFLRLLGDHCRVSLNTKVEALKRKEIEFCVRVFKEEFRLCLKFGRDLVRLLQDLAHVPEFRDIWKDLLLHPNRFKTFGFYDILQLYQLRTSSRYFLLRISPEMETHLRFLLTHVKLGSQMRYQIWFRKKFINENESVLIDIVRFVCCAHHPSNKVILSNVTPRWAVIGWLLKCCSKNHVEANVKLALFYDWLFFNKEVDNVMNIEPGILLMINSVPKYADMTNNLLEFLFLLMDHYDIEKKDLIFKGVSSALDVVERKGVVQSFDALTNCGVIYPFLKERFAKMLPNKNVSKLPTKTGDLVACTLTRSLQNSVN
ncbi:uncharacterized protein [Rutidosis leptorrhynchoides]|uniref:uncharacterized protein n=1 Tax=Rutidosis leptorrhynchoides TaxID=125765 RepID=UPI003A991DF8